MFNKAKAHLERNTHIAHDWDEFNDLLENKQGFIRAMWCGCRECEDRLKEEVGITSRCMPFAQEKLGENCVVCGKPAVKMVYWGKAY